MLFDYRKVLGDASEAASIDASLDEYLALEGDALSRLRFKRRGPARLSMTEALAQMSMLFAAASRGAEEDFQACLQDVLEQSTADDSARRAVREFYLRNVGRVPGMNEASIARLALARPNILAQPLAAQLSEAD
jgi:hypothetical protein